MVSDISEYGWIMTLPYLVKQNGRKRKSKLSQVKDKVDSKQNFVMKIYVHIYLYVLYIYNVAIK